METLKRLRNHEHATNTQNTKAQCQDRHTHTETIKTEEAPANATHSTTYDIVETIRPAQTEQPDRTDCTGLRKTTQPTRQALRTLTFLVTRKIQRK